MTVDVDLAVAEADEDNNTRAVSVLTALDSDRDGVVDGEETRAGTDPRQADSDGDGLGDADELRTHGTDPLRPDTDEDGLSDPHELAAGTDPLSGASVFEILRMGWTPGPNGTLTLEWSSVAGKRYTVERSVTGVNGPYVPVASGIVATPPVNVYTETVAPGSASSFYRVRVES